MAWPFVEHRLSNGLTVWIEPIAGVKSVACGYLVRTGSRDEVPEQAGVSHFLEHMLFKGTPRRSWEDVTADFDRLGSIYNAFTWKDKTAYYGWVPAERFDAQLELLTDMMQATLPQEEFDTEKKVVLEEIAMGHDELQHHLADLAFEKIYPGHSLSWPVLGYEHSVGQLSREEMAAYLAQRYTADNLVLIVAGSVEPESVIHRAEQLCGGLPRNGRTMERRPPAFRTGVSVQRIDRFKQQAILLAFPAPSAGLAREEDARALAQILGGDNSRIYWNIVQEGLSPSAGAMYLEFHDCALFALSGVCEPENCEEFVAALRRESQHITTEGVLPKELRRVRNKRRTSLAVESEAPYYRLMQLMDDIDYRGRPRTVEDRLAAVDAVTAESIAAYLREFPIIGDGHLVSVGPREWPAK